MMLESFQETVHLKLILFCQFASIKKNTLDLLKNENYFDSYGCAPPQKLSKFKIKRNGYCLYLEYILQGLTSKKDS